MGLDHLLTCAMAHYHLYGKHEAGGPSDVQCQSLRRADFARSPNSKTILYRRPQLSAMIFHCRLLRLAVDIIYSRMGPT